MPVDEVREALDRVVPSYDGRSGDWHGVVAAARSSTALAALAEPRRRRWRPGFLVAVVGAIAVAGAVAILAAPWRDGPLATERALAALGHQPVVHAIVEQPSPHDIVIDLASGRELRGDAHRTEYWYDGERDTLRVRLLAGDKPLPGGEYLLSPEGFFTDRGVQRGQARPLQLDPALEGFASGYREALDSGEATVVGEEVVDGRAAVILRFALPPGPSGAQPSEEVAVDKDNYRPLRYRFSPSAAPGRILSWSEAPRVVEIETIPRDPRDFEPPQPGEPHPGGQTGVDERQLQPEEAASVLGRTVFWPGKAVEGVDLARIELRRLTTTWTNGRVTEGHALMFQYGVDRRTAHLEGKRSLTMTEGTSTEEIGPFDLGGSMPEPGELRLRGVGKSDSGDPEMWFGAMLRDGVYISFESPERELIVAAAKSMMPIR